MAKSLKSALKIICLILLLLLASTGCIIYYLGNSTNGLNWLLTQTKNIAPGKLTYSAVTGSLFGKIQLSDVFYQQDDGLKLQINKLFFSWQFSELLKQKITVRQLQVSGVNISSKMHAAKQEKKNTTTPASLVLPFEVSVQQLGVNDVSIELMTGQSVAKNQNSHAKTEKYLIEQLQLQNITLNQQLSIEKGRLILPSSKELPALDLQWSNTMVLSPPYQSELALNWQFAYKEPSKAILEGFNSQGQLNIKGNADAYFLKIQAKVSGNAIPKTDVLLVGNGNQKQLEIENLKAHLLDGDIKSHALISWEPDLILQLHADTQTINIQKWQASFPIDSLVNSKVDLNYQQQKLIIKTLNIHLPQFNSSIDIVGQVEHVITQPQADLQLKWQNLQWPMKKKEIAPSAIIAQTKQGSATLKGNSNDYQLDFNALLQGKDIPAALWQGKLSGNNKQLTSFQLDSNILAGETKITGKVNWLPQISWQMDINAKELKPQQHWPELKGKLALELHNQGAWQNDQLITDVDLQQLQGTLQGYPLKLSAQLHSNGDKHHLKHFDFYSANNHISADANILLKKSPASPKIAVNFKIDAPDIATFLPNASGLIKGNGSIGGSSIEPKIKAEVTANKIKFHEFRLAQLDAFIDYQTQKSQALNIKIKLKQLKKLQQDIFQKLVLSSQGSLSKQQTTLSINNKKDSLQLSLVGGYKEQQWSGLLKQLNIQSNDMGNWGLTQATKLKLSAQQAQLQQSCIKSLSYADQICTTANWQKDQLLNFNAGISQINLARIAQPFLAKNLQLDGLLLNGKISSELSSATKTRDSMDINALMQLNLSPGNISSQDQGQSYKLPFKGLNIEATINQSGLIGQINSAFFEQSSFSGKFQLANLKQFPIAKEQTIQANFSSAFLDFTSLPAFVPMLKNTSGKLNADFKLNGNLFSPQIQGELSLDASTDIPDLGLQLKKIQTQIETDESYQKLNIKGEILSGEGFNRFNGTVNLADISHWQTKLAIIGEKFLAFNTDDFKIWLEPDLQLNISPGAVNIAGKLTIPKAEITPKLNFKANANKVTVSSDVMIIDEKVTTSLKNENLWKISGQLDIFTGNELQIRVEDFKSNLTGYIRLNFDPNKLIPDGQGEFNILGGTYKAYGQDLEVTEGRVFFMHQAVDNPNLGIRAIRKIKSKGLNEVNLAGVDVRGTAKNPTISLFSEPMVVESDIISYLLTGSAMSSNNIKSRELTLGKYISPSFYVSVGYDIFAGNKSFNLRYDISKRWALEGLAGDKESGLDFSFSLGR